MPKCIDCGDKTKNRSKTTLRCRSCDLIRRSKSTGRVTGACRNCGLRLSQKKSKTELCLNCYFLQVKPWNKGVKGIVPWNNCEEEQKKAFNYTNCKPMWSIENTKKGNRV